MVMVVSSSFIGGRNPFAGARPQELFSMLGLGRDRRQGCWAQGAVGFEQGGAGSSQRKRFSDDYDCEPLPHVLILDDR